MGLRQRLKAEVKEFAGKTKLAIANLIGIKKRPKLIDNGTIDENDIVAHDIINVEIPEYVGPDHEERVLEIINRTNKEMKEFLNFQSEVAGKCSQIGSLATTLMLRISDTLETDYLKAMNAEERMRQKIEAKIAEEQLRDYEIQLSNLKVRTEIENEALEKSINQTKGIIARAREFIGALGSAKEKIELKNRADRQENARVALKHAYRIITNIQEAIKQEKERMRNSI